MTLGFLLKNAFCPATALHGSVVRPFVIPTGAEGSAVFLKPVSDSNENAASQGPVGRPPNVSPARKGGGINPEPTRAPEARH
jgi:hypothetical protein